MILLILKMIFLLTCWVVGYKVASGEGMLFEKLGTWGERMSKEYPIFKGLLVCPYCLPNLHGLIFVYPLALALDILPDNLVWYKYIAMYPFVLGASSFISGSMWDWYLRNNARKELIEIQTCFLDKKDFLLEEVVEVEKKRREDNEKIKKQK